MTKKHPLLTDAYEEWLKLQSVTPATRRKKETVEADTYDQWVMERVEKRHSKRI
ncbi:MAG: hypothetical protein HY297_05850 [Thaumarchaeota archaeon]|nr:hypothetical protein [Nitrososphaerota archaeon]